MLWDGSELTSQLNGKQSNKYKFVKCFIMEDIFEKARVDHKQGDIHPNGKWYWESSAKGGKGDWRVIKKNKNTNPSAKSGNGNATQQPTPSPKGASTPAKSQQPQQKPIAGKGNAVPEKKFEDMTPDEIVKFAEEAKTPALENAINNKKLDKSVRQIAFNVLKKREDYDKTKVNTSDLDGGYIPKPTPKVAYKTKKPDVEIDLADTWTVRVPGKNGVLENKTASASGLRRLYASKTDDELLKILNNPNGRWQNRQIAYDEAAARGIDEDKIDVSGKLQKEWDAQKRRHDYAESLKGGFNEEEADAVEVDFKGLDHEAFMKEFPDGDLGWLNPEDPRVQKQFNGLKTITDRQQYDALKTYYEPTTPGYLNPDNKTGQLNEQYDNFIKYDTTPLFVSAGGAGIGKTYGWEAIAKENNLVPLKPGEDPENKDWGYVMVSDPDDEVDFRKMLAKYNGTYVDDDGEEHPRILVFDDADKILTSRAGAMKALMKKITDNNPENRIFTNPKTGENEVFKGAILILTNKNVSAISSANEDAKAILSRGIVNDIQFTRAESMQIINNRYKDMKLGSYQKAFEKQFPDKKKQMEIREIARDWIEENVNDADPGKFTPRTFIQVMSLIGPIFAEGGNNKVRMINGTVQVGTNVPWQTQALRIIKAGENDFEKANSEDEYTEEAMVEAKEQLLKNKEEAKKKDKKRYNVLYSKRAVDTILFGEDGEVDDDDVEDAEKALDIDIMSISDAEDILLG